MKKIILCFLFVMGNFAFAGTREYEIAMDISLHGKTFGSVKVQAKEGVASRITEKFNGEEVTIEVIAVDKMRLQYNEIWVRYVAEWTNKEGIKKEINKGGVIVPDGGSGPVMIGENLEKGTPRFFLLLVPRRKN
jgi:hypothetical protein